MVTNASQPREHHHQQRHAEGPVLNSLLRGFTKSERLTSGAGPFDNSQRSLGQRLFEGAILEGNHEPVHGCRETTPKRCRDSTHTGRLESTSTGHSSDSEWRTLHVSAACRQPASADPDRQRTMRIWLFVTPTLFTAIRFSLRPAGPMTRPSPRNCSRSLTPTSRSAGRSRGFPVELYEFHACPKTRIQLPPRILAISSAV